MTADGCAGGMQLGHPVDRVPIGAVVRLFKGDMPAAQCIDPATKRYRLIEVRRLRTCLPSALDALDHKATWSRWKASFGETAVWRVF